MSGQAARSGIVPACLSFLSVYNPSLSTSDETASDQIVYYYSKKYATTRSSRRDGGAEPEKSQEQINEQLRQVGLAQGIVQFAKDFSNGAPVESIDTDKSRIVLHNVEGSWWILASIDLTKISTVGREVPTNKDGADPAVTFEYSAREVSPSPLLVQQILRAHRIFLLHHSPSLSELWAKHPRHKFCGLLKRFWDNFIWTWEVLLHGNPAVDIYNGIKLSAGGELGVGVDEVDWGSGEREVLEGFIDRTEGLVDLIVSRYGDPTVGLPPSTSGQQEQAPRRIGGGHHPEPSDGVIFSGKGSLTRISVRDVSKWVDCISTMGENAYGVRDNPSSANRRRRKKQNVKKTSKDDTAFTIPPPITGQVKPVKARPAPAAPNDQVGTISRKDATEPEEEYGTSTDTIVKYLTLGVYGSTWGIPSGRPMVPEQTVKPGTVSSLDRSADLDIDPGSFAIGLMGDLADEGQTDEENAVKDAGASGSAIEQTETDDRRIAVRTLCVERIFNETNSQLAADGQTAKSVRRFDRLRVVVYIQPPFIFTLLFELETYALALPSFYRSLHHQLGPLHKPLQAITSPDRVRERLKDAVMPRSTVPSGSGSSGGSVSNQLSKQQQQQQQQQQQPISNLVCDPVRLTIHSTIPNIPEIGGGSSSISGSTVTTSKSAEPSPIQQSQIWSRAEAITVHAQILEMHTSTRHQHSQLEQTSKTGRGWWVVWMRLPNSTRTTTSPLDGNNGSPTITRRNYNHNYDEETDDKDASDASPRTNESAHREAFLIRRASDYRTTTTASGSMTSASRLGGIGARWRGYPSAGGGGGGGSSSRNASDGAWSAPGRLAEGIGIDARQYVEGLLSLTR